MCRHVESRGCALETEVALHVNAAVIKKKEKKLLSVVSIPCKGGQ